MATITIPAQLRSGTVTTPDAAWPAGTKQADLALNLPVQADRDATANHLDCLIEFSRDGGATWEAHVMAGWNGGSGKTVNGVLNPAPTVSVSGPKAGTRVRATLVLNNPMTVGATLVTT